MTYFESAAAAPPGAARFTVSDLQRLPADVLEAALAYIPTSEHLLLDAGDPLAQERAVRACFWTLVYNLEPERWDALSQAEPIHPGVLELLPADGARVAEIGAGSGRLTVNLAARARALIAVEPVAALREILHRRAPGIAILDAHAEELPIADRWADLTVSCGAFGPEPACLAEFERCTRRGGTVALISPELPGWFETHGYRRLSFDPKQVTIPPHDPSLEEFFGPLDPPHELLLRTL